MKRAFGPAFLAVIIAVLGWFVVVAVAASSSRLRPVSDDYCHATNGLGGYFDAIGIWYLQWIGDLFQLSVTGLLMGQPLVHFPLAVSSAIPFLFTAFSVTAITSFLLVRSLRGPKRSIALAIFAGAPLMLVVWWGHWWAPSLLEKDASGTASLLATATTNWQTVNLQYTAVPMILIGVWTMIHTRDGWPRWARTIGLLVVGLLAGTGGLVFGVAAIAFVALRWLASSWLDRRVDRNRLPETAAFVFAALVGLAVAYLSPGAQSRGELLAAGRPLQSVSPWSIFSWVFPESVFEWISGLFQAGTPLVLISSIGISLVLAMLRVDVVPLKLMSAGGCLIAFSFLIAIAARAGAGFSYSAFWHQVMPRSVSFVALILVGTAAGAWLLARSNRVIKLIIVVSVLVAGAVSIGSLLAMNSQIQTRHTAWQSGPAPLVGVADIETDWVENCWTRWSNVVELPARNN